MSHRDSLIKNNKELKKPLDLFNVGFVGSAGITASGGTFVVNSETATYGDPIMRGSPTTGGQYFDATNTTIQGITVSTVYQYLDRVGTGGGSGATITCRVNGTTIGTIVPTTIPTYTAGGGLLTFTGIATAVTPASAYQIDFVMSGYSGSPPSDYVRFGMTTTNAFSTGYATQSGGDAGGGRDLCMSFDYT